MRKFMTIIINVNTPIRALIDKVCIMKFITALLVGAASVAPASATNKPFNIMALRSASPIHFASTSAALSNLYLYYSEQNASCADGSDNNGVATFYIRGDELFLFGAAAEQKVFVDRSGMGRYLHQGTAC